MTAPLRENPLGHVVPQQGVVTPLTPARRWCQNNGPRPGWLPPDKFHCAQDHGLQQRYGITCDDYWELYALQMGRCGICRQPWTGGRRLVVDHDHDTGAIDGLCHFGCNRRLKSRVRRYLADPPARRLGLAVPVAKLRRIEEQYQAKRKRERPRPTPTPAADDFHARTQAALQATKQGR